jgi:hypothetical protein
MEKIKILKKLMEKLYEDDRFNYIFDKIFNKHSLTNDPNSILFSLYENTVWREKREKPSERTFGQSYTKIGEFGEITKIRKTKNEIFPHTYKFIILRCKDSREEISDTDFLIMADFIGERMVLESERKVIYVGTIKKLIKQLAKELNRDPDAPLFVVWYGNDPRIIEDYYGEVYEEVRFIGYEDEAFDFWRRAKQYKKRHEYYSYPEKMENPNQFEIGEKKVFHSAKKPPKSRYDYEVEQAEIRNGY